MSSAKRRLAAAKTGRTDGPFVIMPKAFLTSPVCAGLSPSACKLLLDLCSQFRYGRNGDLCASWTTMQPRGWKSRETLWKALKELEAAQLIIRTREGGRNRATLYALAFYAIDHCDGKLDIGPTRSASPLWHKDGTLLGSAPLKPQSRRAPIEPRKNMEPDTPRVEGIEGLDRAACPTA